MLILVFMLFGIPAMFIYVQFFSFLFTGKKTINIGVIKVMEIICLIIFPLMYANFGKKNDCCADDFDTAVFAPEHQLTVGVIITLCLIAYFYSSSRTKIAPPLTEVLINIFLIIGIVLNVIIGIHTNSFWLAMGGNMPIAMLAILALIKNQSLFLRSVATADFINANKTEIIIWKFLSMPPLIKFPALLLLCLPVLILLTIVLLLTGQKPDSAIRAFTDTYKHGFSQLDYQCANVECGGHYLCSVAANGHKEIVKPQRFGTRNGNKIICNRQLLVSNAFEDLLHEKLPTIHKVIRKRYNKVGDFVHRYYSIFNIKLVSDIIYIIMKPLEWFFIIVLYTLDTKPENRIAKQYLRDSDRKRIEAFEL